MLEQMVTEGPPMVLILGVFALVVVINAITLAVAGRWVTGLDVGFGTALGAVLLTMICCFVLFVIFAFTMVHVNRIVAQIAAMIIPPFVPLAVQVLVIRWRLDVTVVGALLITLVMMALCTAVTVLFLGIFVVVFVVGGPFELPPELTQAAAGAP